MDGTFQRWHRSDARALARTNHKELGLGSFPSYSLNRPQRVVILVIFKHFASIHVSSVFCEWRSSYPGFISVPDDGVSFQVGV